jgi:hypothetical protein
VASTPTGGTLCLNGGSYSLGGSVSVAKAMRIVGVNAPSLTQTFPGRFFSIQSSNVTIQGLTMRGANRSRTGESCAGTEAIRVIGAVSGVQILDNTISSMTCGVIFDTPGNLSPQVRRNHLDAIKYGAIVLVSSNGGVVDSNVVTNTDVDGPLGENAYPIVVTATTGTHAVNVMVSNNTVRQAPTWECLDTHDGDSITFSNNICVSPGRTGLMAGNGYGHTPQNIVVTGNTFDRGTVTFYCDNSGSSWCNSVGFGSAVTGSVTNNTFLSWADSGDPCGRFSPGSASVSGNTCAG